MAAIKRISKGDYGFSSVPGFRIVEADGTVTKIYRTQDLDLTIEQTRPGQEEPSVYSEYSNPGVKIYAGFLRFLHEQQIKVPEIPKPVKIEGLQHDTFASAAMAFGIGAAHSPFPWVYDPSIYKTMAHLKPVSTTNRLYLNLVYAQHHLQFSSELVQALVRYIPKVYPHFSCFQTMANTINRQIREGHFRPTRLRRITQHEFAFMRDKKDRAIKKKLPVRRRKR